jgi:hypothetical protein
MTQTQKPPNTYRAIPAGLLTGEYPGHTDGPVQQNCVRTWRPAPGTPA